MRISLFRSLLFALVMLSASVASSAQVFVSVGFAPPPLPVYEQPLCPGEDYIWVPGYWAWNPVGYYWVPGTWLLAPEPSLLWTPGYWAYEDAVYYWHPGYWGPVVGYYGGVAYGYGYPGTGYYGGYWRDRHFYYNETVNNVNITSIHYVYRATVVENSTAVNRVSFNGGPGGTRAHPTPQQEAAARERRIPPTSVQMQHEHAASTDRALLASVNQGRPPVAATPKPAEFRGHGVIAASKAGAPYKAPENRAAIARPSTPVPRTENRPETRDARPQPEMRSAPARPSAPAPRPENRPETRAARPQPEMRSAPARPSVPPAPRPENRPEARAARPQPEPRSSPAPRPEAPRPPSASSRPPANNRDVNASKRPASPSGEEDHHR